MTSSAPADRLREAATKIRKHAADATPGPWAAEEPELPWGEQADAFLIGNGKPLAKLNSEYNGPLNAAWIALMHPGVGEALAAWLDGTAELHEQETDPRTPGCQWCADEDWPCSDMRHALAVADAILGPEVGQ